MLPDATDRGVSTVVGYIIALSITTVLVGGLIAGSSTFLRGQQERVADETLSVVGEQVATGIASVDAPPNSDEERVRLDLPDRVAGQQYRIEVEQTAGPSTSPATSDDIVKSELTLTTDSPPVEVSVPVTTKSEIVSDSGSDAFAINGGEVVIERDSGQLVMKNA